MAHMIENEEVAWIGKRPWYQFGAEMLPGASTLQWLQAAKLNWEVEMRDLAFMLPGPTGDLVNPLTKFKAVTRADNDRVFTVATESYHPMQNLEVVDFFREFCDAGHATMEVCGALKGGAIVWALAKLTGEASRLILGNDLVEGYLMLATAHDCSMQTIGRATQVRAVCWNTISRALVDRAGSRTQFRMSHMRKWTPEVAEEAKRTMGMAIEALVYTNALSEKLAKATLDDKGWMDFMDLLLGAENVKDAKGVLKPTANAIWTATQSSPGAELVSAKGTLFGAVNGVTYFADHVRGASAESRLRHGWFGEGERLKNDAMQIAMDMAGVS
jgi:phage/plasmid-like protein (TIGR03299 family)